MGHITVAAMIKQIKEYHGKLYDNTLCFWKLSYNDKCSLTVEWTKTQTKMKTNYGYNNNKSQKHNSEQISKHKSICSTQYNSLYLKSKITNSKEYAALGIKQGLLLGGE